MAKEIATTKWCPCCNHSQKIKGFRSYRCRDCWVAAGKPKIEVYFKAMDKSEAMNPASIKKLTKTVSKPAESKPIVLIEDRPKKRATRKKVVKKPVKKK